MVVFSGFPTSQRRKRQEPRSQGLLLPLSKQLPETSEECPVRVYRWKGPFVAGGSIPVHLQMLWHGQMDGKKRIKRCFFLEGMKKPLHVEITEEWEFLLNLPFCVCQGMRIPWVDMGTLFLSDSRNVGNTIYVDTIVTGRDVTEEQEFCWNFSQQKPSCQADLHYPSCWSNKNHGS